MCTGFEMGALALGALSASASIVSGQKQQSAEKSAANQADANAQATLKASTEANNQANQNSAALPTSGTTGSQIMPGAGGKGGGGIGSTMLTGPTGVDPSALSLGKSTLLGA